METPRHTTHKKRSLNLPRPFYPGHLEESAVSSLPDRPRVPSGAVRQQALVSFIWQRRGSPAVAMSPLREVHALLLDWRVLSTALVFVLTYFVGRFYHKVSKYPKGPFPYPVVGNLLSE
ncbi:hypothetical protein HPB48_007641 [Haemaphysalis longicornis]|uniref:Uncharacterized protein n=1 Tax=Haemaphysalis longicornis TaxID=44386 RepID=A0A9J6G2J0_HAELO|nr:hypothetical protein HPB48_007641 [Haemaphysalis longicornis]